MTSQSSQMLLSTDKSERDVLVMSHVRGDFSLMHECFLHVGDVAKLRDSLTEWLRLDGRATRHVLVEPKPMGNRYHG